MTQDDELWMSRRINRVTVFQHETEVEAYWVGYGGVTAITPALKNGEFASLPYVQVWKGDALYAEFIQHRCDGVYFEKDPADGK